jgi:hypothetical protein
MLKLNNDEFVVRQSLETLIAKLSGGSRGAA